MDKGDEKVEELKGQIISTQRNNNTFRVTTIGLIASGVYFSGNLFSDANTEFNIAFRHGLIIGGVGLALIFNNAFNNRDKKLTTMLRKANKWSRQQFTPDEVQTFHDLYEAVKSDFKNGTIEKQDIKNSNLSSASAAFILGIGIATVASTIDQLNPDFWDDLISRKEDTELRLDPNDPFLTTGQELRFPAPRR